jgi:pimeloyl-ACP methyl ester carboxylesterase
MEPIWIGPAWQIFYTAWTGNLKERTMHKNWKWIKRMIGGLFLLIIILTVVTAAAGLFAKRQLARQNLPPGQWTDINYYSLHIYCTGEGSPTVILEAGMNDFYVTWAKVQPEIARSTRVCSYDRAGLGWSQPSPNPRTSTVMAEELHSLLRNTGIEGPYILVGHSLGGIVIRDFARQYPNQVAGMVLVDSAHEEQTSRLPFLKDSADELVAQFRTLSLLSSSGLMALSPATIPNRGFPEGAYRQYQAVLAATDYFHGAIAETTAFYSDSPQPKPASLGDLPLVVLSHGLPEAAGEGSAQQLRYEQEWTKMQKELAGLSSNSKQIIAEKSGHNVQLDQPELVIASILELIQAGQ